MPLKRKIRLLVGPSIKILPPAHNALFRTKTTSKIYLEQMENNKIILLNSVRDKNLKSQRGSESCGLIPQVLFHLGNRFLHAYYLVSQLATRGLSISSPNEVGTLQATS